MVYIEFSLNGANHMREYDTTCYYNHKMNLVCSLMASSVELMRLSPHTQFGTEEGRIDEKNIAWHSSSILHFYNQAFD